MTIDRRIDELGYIEGNLQIMEVGYNTKKRYVDYYKHNPDQLYKEPPIDVEGIEDWKKLPDIQEDSPF